MPATPTPATGSAGHPPVATALRELAAEGATACLVVAHDDLEARIWLRDGRVCAASAPGARARLGDRLVTARALTAEQLSTALRRQRTRGDAPRLGEVLLELDLIDAETLRRVLGDQAIDSIAVALGWPEGLQRIEREAAGDEDVPIALGGENALMEATRRLDEWSALSQALGSLDARVAFVAGAAPDLALSPDEWAMLTRIDGRHSVHDLAEETGFSGFQAARIVYGLLSTGVVRLLIEPDADDVADAGAAPGLAMPPPPRRPEPPPPTQKHPAGPEPAPAAAGHAAASGSARPGPTASEPEARRALQALLSQLTGDDGGREDGSGHWRSG